MKKIILILLLTIIISGCSNNIKQVCFDKNCFSVELAISPEDRAIGLMNRTYLGANNGMLFMFENEDYHSFWMKDTLMPLDIIWINSDNKVVFIKENAEICLKEKCEIFNPNEKSKYVLEINSSTVKNFNIYIGAESSFK